MRVQLVDVAQALAGITEARGAIRVELKLVDPARYLSGEFFQQPVTRRQGFVHTLAFGDINANRQVPHPQAMVIEHWRGQHIGRQAAAILAYQGPFTWLTATGLSRFGEHGLSQRHLTAQALPEDGGASHQFVLHEQIFQPQPSHHFGTAVPQHQLGTGIEGCDDTSQIGGNDRHLSRGIQHTAQLPMGVAQLALADL
ncbi:hypothetical protein D3C76_897690 [compost metagenome]